MNGLCITQNKSQEKEVVTLSYVKYLINVNVLSHFQIYIRDKRKNGSRLYPADFLFYHLREAA